MTPILTSGLSQPTPIASTPTVKGSDTLSFV